MNEAAVAESAGVETFEQFFHDHYEGLLRTMYLATGDRHEAEDLAQDAMARVFERWDRVASVEDPVGYAYRIALNLRRSRLRRLAVATRKVLTARGSAEPLDLVEERDSIRRALARLTLAEREALILLDWLDISDVRAAEILRTTPGAVRTRASRARTALRTLMEDMDD